jgi:hypothetical protein
MCPGQSGGFVSAEKAKAVATLPGRVEKVISPHPSSGEPEKAQIGIEGADHLYREIRVPNRLVDADGHKVKLKEGAEVEVKIEAEAVVPHTSSTEKKGSQPQP